MSNNQKFADNLLQIGYFNQKQRDFLDKFIYKSEAALSAADISLSYGVFGAKEASSSTGGNSPQHVM
jgi:hypothetical protein